MKKIDSQEAFDQLIRVKKAKGNRSRDEKNVEDEFCQSRKVTGERSRWVKGVLLVSVVLGLTSLLCGVGVFYWFIMNEAEPAMVMKVPASSSTPAVINEAEAKQIIEAHLKAFLSAETNEEREKYIYLPDDEKSSLAIYYNERGLMDTPLWKIERTDLSTTVQGEIWFVVYRDIKKKQDLVSFQRYGDDFLLHWSAFKAFSEVSWPRFIVKKPSGPVMMRGYLRQYKGVWPISIPRDGYHCFLIEDRGGLFSELAVMKTDALGYAQLKNLPKASQHPVTVNLGYRALDGGENRQVLMILSLKHLRWQRLAMDPHVQ